MITLAQAAGAAAAPEWGWRPFIDPIGAHGSLWGGWVFLLIPLAVGIAVVYRAVRQQDLESPGTMRDYVANVLALTAQIVVAMFALGAATFVLIEVYVRFMADHA
ncbi:MAG: hypothetical protein KF745_09165 [Phycisphaeraceae bacterium]|nr:hypothetical protein [Phycisphaeraceae bacterium]